MKVMMIFLREAFGKTQKWEVSEALIANFLMKETVISDI